VKILKTKIESVEKLSGENYQIIFPAGKIAENAKPGQFLEISTAGATLLNKPISISDVDCNRQNLSIVIKVVGAGTRAISNFKYGDEIKIIGPCGNAFPKPEKEAIIVGGGVGIPPLFFLTKSYPETFFTVILGAGAAADIVLEENFRNLKNTKVFVTTDDGSKGEKGTVIPTLKKILQKKKSKIYSCGPKPMLAAVAKTASENNVDAFVSLEAYMGCGIGVCVGCVVPTVRGPERVCKEGAVFSARDILWDEV